MLNVDRYTENAKRAIEHDYFYSFAVGSVIRSKKTGLLWYVNRVAFSCVMITKKDGVLYAPKLHVTCQDGTTTDFYDQLCADRFELVDLNTSQCDRKTFKALRNLINLNCFISGKLANKARECYRVKMPEINLIKSLLAVSLKDESKLVIDNQFKIDHKSRTASFFGRVTPLFQFKGPRRV